MSDGTEFAIAVAMDVATEPTRSGPPARFVLRAPSEGAVSAVRARAFDILSRYSPNVRPMSRSAPDTLIVSLAQRSFIANAGAAYAAAHALGEATGAMEAEPDLPYVPAVEPRIYGFGERENAPAISGCWVGPDPALEGRPRWAPELIGIHKAWKHSRDTGRPAAGKGIVVAHLDTGLRVHPELSDALVLPGLDLVDNDTDPTDPLGYWGNPGHGTSTASLVVASPGGAVCGTAPRAKLLPIRCIESVVVVFAARIAEAIDEAVDRGAHVVTMSLGGLSSFALERALQRAVDADVIVMAAAGNCVGWVVYPAADPNCLAVGGCNVNRQRWQGSCRGLDVDVSAPAENVFRAFVDEAGAPGVGQGEGTSYAVAQTAGVAACWLAHHGRSRVVKAARGRGISVNELFRKLARATASRPPGWDQSSDGAGIVDAAALLAAELETGAERENSADRESVDPATPALRRALAAASDPAMLSDVKLAGSRHELVAHLMLRDARPDHNRAVSPSLAEVLGVPALNTLGLQAPASASPAIRGKPGVLPMQLAELRRSFALKSPGMEGASRESVPDDAELPHPDDVFGMFTSDSAERFLVALPPDEVGDREEMKRALSIVGATARRGLDKLRDGATHGNLVTPEEMAGLEAVIETDGTRPSFVLRSGAVDLSHPLVGKWLDDLVVSMDAVARLSSSVCRIQPSSGGPGSFFGTGTLVDPGKGLVLTNFHVLAAILRAGAPSVVNVRDPKRINFYGGVVVDFDGEIGRPPAVAFKVVEAVIPEGAGMTASTVDVAMLRIQPIDPRSTTSLPAGVKLTSDLDLPNGAVPNFCMVGFPAKPEKTTGFHEGIDWGWVTTILFGNRFGVKRLAPGTVKSALGGLGRDYHPSIFTHDATTLGGSSGSLLYSWKDMNEPAGGIHFAGKSRVMNEAHGFFGIRNEMRAIGAPF